MGVEVDQKSIKGVLKDDNAEKLSNETKLFHLWYLWYYCFIDHIICPFISKVLLIYYYF